MESSVNLQFPEIRWNLTSAVEHLALPEEALDGGLGVSFAINILLDDFQMDVERQEDVGAFLIDEAESRAAAGLSRELNAILLEIEPSTDDADYRTHPRWPTLVRLANRMLALLYRDCAGANNCPHPAFMADANEAEL